MSKSDFQPLVIDNFFTDPDAIRDFALKQEFWPKQTNPNGGNWPGFRSDYISALDNDIFLELMYGVHDAIGISRTASTYTEAFFQFCTERDGDSWVHRDTLAFEPTHVGLVYLTPNPPPNSGTILYENKDPNYVKGDPELDSGDVNDYNVKLVLENHYNRLVVYSPDEFHKSDTYFGQDRYNSRLFVVFFMRVN